MDDEDDDLKGEPISGNALCWWSAGRLSVSIVWWYSSCFDDPKNFYENLRQVVPVGTQVYGRKLVMNDSGVNRYMTIFGFPYRLENCVGFERCLVSRLTDSESVIVRYWSDDTDVDQCLDWFQSNHVESLGKERTFGERFECKGEDKLRELPLLLKTVGDMWSVREVVRFEMKVEGRQTASCFFLLWCLCRFLVNSLVVVSCVVFLLFGVYPLGV